MVTLERRNDHFIYADTEMNVRIPLPENVRANLVQTAQIPEMKEEAAIRRAVREPVCGLTLPEIVRQKQAETACVLISDATRAVPTAKMLKYVVEELAEGGIRPENILCVVAIGVHRNATEEEIRTALGDLYGKVKAENHEPYNKNALVDLGRTSFGTPVLVNRRAYECDIHIQIGKVEPHEFAGFSGGRKSVLPGISSEETIHINHRPEMILHPNAANGKLAGNPVHQDMVEAARKFGIDFGVNCVLNRDLKLAAVFAGDLEASHEAAVNYVREKLIVKLKKPDVIVTKPGQPLDIDFYQSVKALIALTEVLDQDIQVVLYCGCREGVNSPDMLRAFRSGSTIAEAIHWTTDHYEIQMDHVLLLSKIFRKGVKIRVVCPNTADNELSDMFFQPETSLEEAIAGALSDCGKAEPLVTFYPSPQTGLPELA